VGRGLDAWSPGCRELFCFRYTTMSPGRKRAVMLYQDFTMGRLYCQASARCCQAGAAQVGVTPRARGQR